MIRHWQPFPIRHERILRAAQHRPDVMRVMIGRIKIGVVTDFRGQLHDNVSLPMENAVAQFSVIAQRRRVSGEQFL